MKKKYLVIIALLLILPFGVYASDDPAVLEVNAERDGSTINFNGTTEDDVHAVMCKLFNSSNEEVDMFSTSVEENTFSGSFTNVEDGDYNVLCARYEGGVVRSAQVVDGATNGNGTDDNSTGTGTTNNTNNQVNPKTYDAGITGSIIMLIVCIVGMVGSIIFIKKIKKD